MPLINRDKDQSEQRECFTANLNVSPPGISFAISGLITGQTLPFCNIPYPASIVTIDQSSYGVSGAPVHSVSVYRFIAGAGLTQIPVGLSLAITAFGTSGIQSYTLLAGTSATLPLLAGDQLVLNTLVSSTAVQQAQVTVVVKALQDIKNHFGV